MFKVSPFGNQGFRYDSDLAKKTDKEDRQSSLKTIIEQGTADEPSS